MAATANSVKRPENEGRIYFGVEQIILHFLKKTQTKTKNKSTQNEMNMGYMKSV